MASLVLGAVGAFAGSFVGMPALGWAIGSALGSALFPGGKDTQGPRLSDLKLQQSTYGSMIPILYGTCRIAGNVIWQTDLTEHATEESQGKGDGPTNTTFTYSASFAIALCEGEILTVPRIWADSRLVYDVTAATTPAVETPFYSAESLSAEDWHYFVRNPAVWGLVLASDFKNQKINEFSQGGFSYDPSYDDSTYTGTLITGVNAESPEPLPELPFTLYLGTEDQLPDPTMEAVEGAGNVPGYRGTAYIVFTDLDLSAYGNRIPSFTFEVATEGGTIPVRYNSFTPLGSGGGLVSGVEFDGSTITIAKYTSGVGTSVYETASYTADGTLIDSTSEEALHVVLGSNVQLWITCTNNSHIAFGATQTVGETAVTAWYIDGIKTVTTVAGPIVIVGDYWSVNQASGMGVLVFADDYLYALGGIPSGGTPRTWVARYPCIDNVPAHSPDLFYEFPDHFLKSGITVSDAGDVYVSGDTNNGSEFALYKFDAELNLQDTWDWADLPVSWLGTAAFTVYKGKLLFQYTDEVADGGTASLAAIVYEFGTPFVRVNSIPAVSGNSVYLDRGLAMGSDGIISLNPPAGPILLSEIVADVSNRCSLSAYDVSELTDEVDGYVIANQMTGRAMIEPLLPIYFFDGVESDAQVKFPKRGGDPIIVIPDDELAAHTDGNLPPILGIMRAQEVDLPQKVNVLYLNKDADYQNGTQLAQRMVGGSREAMTIEAPIVLSDAKAKWVADAVLHATWIERDGYEFSTSRKYGVYEPTDIVEIQGRAMRVTTKTESGGLQKFKAVGSHDSVFEQEGIAAKAGFTPTVISPRYPSTALLLDIPLLRDADDGSGFYAVAGNAVQGNWPGEVLYKSPDAGASYAALHTFIAQDSYGTTIGGVADFLGGNVFDEATVIRVIMTHGTLSSLTELGVLNGGNTFLVGNEILQAKNCVLVGTDTYDLSGLLRGRRGTEWAISTHSQTERFVVLNAATTRLAAPYAETNQERLYKPVTIGQTLAATESQAFTNTNVGLKPYAPVQLGGGNDGTDVTLTWTRRTRIGGDWVDGTDVLLGEASESYVVQIWDASYSQVARQFIVSVPTVIYTSAMQVTDFGADQQTVFFTVNQIGVLLGRVARGTAEGTGSTNDLPITPIAPYGFVSPPPVGVVNMVLTWPNDTDYTAGFTVGSTFVAQFTTGATAGGYIVLAEYGDPPTYRTAVLSTDAAGLNVVASNASNTVTIFFSGLSPATTYYFVVKNEYADGSPSGPVGSSANAVVQLHGV